MLVLYFKYNSAIKENILPILQSLGGATVLQALVNVVWCELLITTVCNPPLSLNSSAIFWINLKTTLFLPFNEKGVWVKIISFLFSGVSQTSNGVIKTDIVGLILGPDLSPSKWRWDCATLGKKVWRKTAVALPYIDDGGAIGSSNDVSNNSNPNIGFSVMKLSPDLSRKHSTMYEQDVSKCWHLICSSIWPFKECGIYWLKQYRPSFCLC